MAIECTTLICDWDESRDYREKQVDPPLGTLTCPGYCRLPIYRLRLLANRLREPRPGE